MQNRNLKLPSSKRSNKKKQLFGVYNEIYNEKVKMFIDKVPNVIFTITEAILLALGFWKLFEIIMGVIK